MSDRSTYPPPTRTLPTSTALSEAQPLSMQELFSRNPELYNEENIASIVLQMRDLRVRLEQTSTAARTRAPSSSRVPRGVVPGGMGGLLDDDDDC